jgi:hypothetical protein
MKEVIREAAIRAGDAARMMSRPRGNECKHHDNNANVK